jgi:outer membrane protein
MKAVLLFLFIAGAIFSLNHIVLANEVKPTDSTLTLKNALDLNLKNSFQIAIGREKVIEKKSVSLERKAVFLPKLSLNISDRSSTTNLKAEGISFPGFPDKIGPFGTFDARLTFNETLLNVNLLNEMYAADEETKTANLELSQTESDLLYQTSILFLTALKTQSSVLTDQANVALSEELLKFAEHEKEMGIATVLDVTRAQVKLAEDRQRLITAVSQKNDAILNLQKQVGIRQGEQLSLDEGYLPEANFPEIQESLQIALSRRKELAIQSQKEKVKEIQFKAASGEKFPSVGIFADYGDIGNGIYDAFPTQTVGITLNWPFYDGNVRKSHEQTIMSQLLQEKDKSKDAALQIELDVRQIYNELNSIKKEFELAGERLSLAEKELALAQHRFEHGIGTHIELIKSQTSLTEAREALVETQFEVRAGILKYFYVTGQMDEFFSQLP